MKNISLMYPVLLAGILSSFLFTCKKEAPKTVPVVSIGEVTNITSTSANCAGEVTFDGGAPVTSAGICWSATNANPTIFDSKTEETASLKSFNGSLSGLAQGTIYNVRAYASNAVGYAYSSNITFKTLWIFSTAASSNIGDVTSTSAVLTNNITDDGGDQITARGICWSINANPTIADNKTTDGSVKGIFTSTMTGLNPGTTYYVRIYATNSTGTVYGNVSSFTTQASVPVITLDPITKFSATGATITATVTNDGGSPVTERGFGWNTLPNQQFLSNSVQVGSGTGSFTGSYYVYSPGATFYVRAYAKNSNGMGYSNEVSYTAPFAVPSLIIRSVTNITATTATSASEINYDGGKEITEKGVCWSLSDNPTIADSKTSDGNGLANFTSSITGLTPARIYYARAYATNSVGTGYGNLKIFNTPMDNCNGCEIVKIKYGTSFGMCWDYCISDLVLSPGTNVFTKKGWSTTLPTVSCTGALSDADWNNVKTGVDINAFFSLAATIGCPDCSDGGSEWIEMELNNGSTHRANWDIMQGVPAAIKDYVNLLRSLMSNYSNNCH